jgi:hypothetical protein
VEIIALKCQSIIFSSVYFKNNFGWLKLKAMLIKCITGHYIKVKRISTPRTKWAHELSREFSKEEVQLASKYM